MQRLGGGNQREGDQLEVLGVDGWIIIIWFLGEVGCGGLDCIPLA